MCLITFILNTSVDKTLSHLQFECNSVKWEIDRAAPVSMTSNTTELRWPILILSGFSCTFGTLNSILATRYTVSSPGDDVIVVTAPVLKLTMPTVGVHVPTGIMPRVIVITCHMLPGATRNLGVNSVHFLGWNLDVLITGTVGLQQNVTGNVHIVTEIMLFLMVVQWSMFSAAMWNSKLVAQCFVYNITVGRARMPVGRIKHADMKFQQNNPGNKGIFIVDR